MTLTNSETITLPYGRQGRFTCRIDPGRIAAVSAPPEPLPDVRLALRQALAAPLDFPPLQQALIADDHVLLALDRHTPEAAALIRETWEVLDRRGVEPFHVTVMQPASQGTRSAGFAGTPLPDPRIALPEAIRDHVRWLVHDPRRENCRYLASTTAGERVYLSGDVVDADVVISIGPMAYDSLTGYRGTNSVFYPGMATAAAVERAHGQGHRELGPDDERPLRQLMDEVGWLLGTQFSIQVIPSAGSGVSDVIAGLGDSVFRRGKQLLAERWLVELDDRPETVVAAVDADAGGHGWEQVGAALETAHNLVARGGRIIVLSELDAEPGRGLQLMRECRTPRDAIQPLRTLLPNDLVAATQLAGAADWARVDLLSGLERNLVEELFMTPLTHPDEAARLLEGDKPCAFLASAQHVYGRLREPR